MLKTSGKFGKLATEPASWSLGFDTKPSIRPCCQLELTPDDRLSGTDLTAHVGARGGR